MPPSFSIRARWVVPVDSPPIEGGVVTVVDGLIADISTKIDTITEDLGDVVVLPGLVNSHTHLEFSDLAQPLGQSGMQLPDWIRLVIASRQHALRNSKQAIQAGLLESSQAGVTSIGDIATECLQDHSDKSSPYVVGFQEVIGFSAARCDSALADVSHRLESGPSHVCQGISPHAPYTVHPKLLERLVELANQRNIPVAMHLAESTEELELLATGKGPFQQLLDERSMWDPKALKLNSCPLDYLKVLAQAPRAIVVHGNYLAPDEIDFIAHHQDRMSVIYCPRTHHYFAHQKYPLQQMFDAGVRVAIGTDSKASNPSLGLLDEMRYVANTYSAVAPETILRMGTLSGAEALGLAKVCGSVSCGKRADFTVLPLIDAGNKPIESILNSTQTPLKTYLSGYGLEI